MPPSELLPDEPRIQAGYDQMWQQSASDLARGSVDVDPVPDDTSRRWGLSIIARIPTDQATLFTDISAALRPWTGEHHTFYTAANLHLTVRSCEFYRSTIAPDDAALRDYQRVLHDVAAQTPPFSIRYRGLAANRTGIIVQGFPQTSHLQQLRQTIHQRLQQLGRTPGPEAEQVRYGAHVSLAVFAGPLADPQMLASFIERQRTHTYGSVTITSLEVVRYQRSLQQVAITPYAQAALVSAR